MKILSVEAKLSHAEGRTDSLEAKIFFLLLQFCDRTKQILKNRTEGTF